MASTEPREKWSALKLAYTSEQRARIMACIQRLNGYEKQALDRAVLVHGTRTLPRPHLRRRIRSWYRKHWEYLLSEYEKVLPHVSELPDETVEYVVRGYLMQEAMRERSN